MTPQQLTTLKAAILAETDPAFIVMRTANDETSMAGWYNSPTSPAFVVWRNVVSRDELQNLDAFNWTVVDNLVTNSKFRIWEWMFENPERNFNPSKANIRAGIAACWTGNAQLLAVQTAILAACKRTATRVEKLYATGTGSDATPALLVFEGSITAQDISDALRV